MKDRFIKIDELAMILGVHQQCIERWYKFKRQNPDNVYAKMLPDFIYIINSKKRGVRSWKESDIVKIKQFQENIVAGRNGFMRNSKKEEKNNGKGKSKNNRSKMGKEQNRGRQAKKDS